MAADASAPSAPLDPAATHHWVGRYFDTLGAEIERRIGAGEPGGDAFADAATDVLKTFAPPQPINVTAMAEWVASAGTLPRQVNAQSRFGQPPLVVHVNRAFYLEVLFWFPSRTSIHGHAFSGAFRVLDGYSVQTTYAFKETEALAGGLRAGELTTTNLELLLPGDVCDIRAEEAFVHSVVHMGFPSLTLVARTFREADVIQYTYCRCGVAFSAAGRVEITRQIDVLLALARRTPAAAMELILALLERQDVFARFTSVFSLAARADIPGVAGVLAEAQTRWPQVARLAQAAFDEEARRERVFRQLGLLPDSRTQLVGVLGELLGSKEAMLRALAEFQPAAAPETTLARWASLVPAMPNRA